MLKNLQQVTALICLVGATAAGCNDAASADCEGTDCPTDGCPTDGCPTGTSGFAADFATGGAFFTQMTDLGPGADPHPANRIWYSETMRSGVEGMAAFTAAVGDTSIKVHYDAAEAIAGYTVMTKQAAGFDDANENWFYEGLDAQGAVTASGALAGCIGCHEASPDTDYLLGTDLTN